MKYDYFNDGTLYLVIGYIKPDSDEEYISVAGREDRENTEVLFQCQQNTITRSESHVVPEGANLYEKDSPLWAQIAATELSEFAQDKPPLPNGILASAFAWFQQEPLEEDEDNYEMIVDGDDNDFAGAFQREDWHNGKFYFAYRFEPEEYEEGTDRSEFTIVLHTG